MADKENHSCADYVREVLFTAKQCGNISPKMKQLGDNYQEYIEKRNEGAVKKLLNELPGLTELEAVSKQTCVHYNYWTKKVLNEELTFINWTDIHLIEKMKRIVKCIQKEL